MIPSGITFDEAAHLYTVNGKPYASVTQVIAEAGIYGDTSRFDDRGRERGTFVHKAIQLHLDGNLDRASLDPALVPYLAAWDQFEVDTGFYPAYLEHVLYSDVLRVAGRVDLIGPLNGGAAIIDIKTGQPSPATGIQLAGYEHLYGVSAKRFALHLTDTGKYRLIEYADRNDRAVFLAAVTLHNWKQANVKGG